MAIINKRHRFPWSMNEINRLYNEYELKQLTISQIAVLHERTDLAILNKLEQEKLIESSWNDARGWSWANNADYKDYLEHSQHNYHIDDDKEEEEEEEVDDDGEDDDDDEDYEPIIEEPSSSDEDELDDDDNGTQNISQQIKNLLDLLGYFKGLLPTNVKKANHFSIGPNL